MWVWVVVPLRCFLLLTPDGRAWIFQVSVVYASEPDSYKVVANSHWCAMMIHCFCGALAELAFVAWVASAYEFELVLAAVVGQ